MLAAQNQCELEAEECFTTTATTENSIDVHDENRRLLAKLSAMTKKLEDLSNTNKSLNNENRRLRDRLCTSSSSSSPPSSARRLGQTKSPKPIPISISAAVTPNEVLIEGLTYAGFEPSRLQRNNHERKVRWFKSFYGVSPTTVAPYLQDIKDMYSRINFKDCLMTMNWMFLYESYPVLTSRWKYSEDYIGERVIEYGLKMAKVGTKKIIFKLNHNVKLGRSVDCVTFMVQEMRLDPSSKWFDYKTHSCGVVSLVSA